MVDEKYTRPQGLYQHKDVDHKKLKRLILDSKLAPCYPGDDESGFDLEECPICFLFYPSLNRSRCCLKGICTECFLQMKTPCSARPTQCPFCKTTNYAVEYRGVKSKEEKGMEQIEEQRVIEAKIRIRQQELQDDEERIQKRQEMSSTGQILVQEEVEYSSAQSFSSPGDGEEIISSQGSPSIVSHTPISREHRDAEFDLDLEDIMVMEAIWLSIQDNERQRNAVDCATVEHVEDCSTSLAEPSSSPSGGLACAIAALAERQQTSGESSNSRSRSENTSASNNPPRRSRISRRIRPEAGNYPPMSSNNDEQNGMMMMAATGDASEWGVLEAAESGNSYASSVCAEAGSEISAAPYSEENGAGFQNLAAPMIPENFEEQMMLAMVVSLTEA